MKRTRLNIKVGDSMCFDNRNGLFGRLVSLKPFNPLNSKITHIGIVYSIYDKYIEVGEALGEGFTIRKYSIKKVKKLVRKERVVFYTPVKRLAPNITKRTIRLFINIKYSFLGIAKIVLSDIFSIRLSGDGDRTVFCSEAVARIYKIASLNEINIAKEFSSTAEQIKPYHFTISRQMKKVSIWIG